MLRFYYIYSIHFIHFYICLLRSGGPLMDIIETSKGSQTGYLAVDTMEYAEYIATILYNTKEENDVIRSAARYVFHFQIFSIYTIYICSKSFN